MTPPVPPRIYYITAAESLIVAVFRRGPTNRSHVGQWDLARLRYERVARRSDLFPQLRSLPTLGCSYSRINRVRPGRVLVFIY